jgi:hypothetical protein
MRDIIRAWFHGMAIGLGLLVVGVALAPLADCAHLQPVVDNLPRAVAYAQDGLIALDIVETAEKTAFAIHPDAALQAKVELGIADARTALDAGLKICLGGEALNQAQIDQAFASFKAAYTDVMALLGPLGIQRVPAASGGKSGARPGGHYLVADPILFTK